MFPLDCMMLNVSNLTCSISDIVFSRLLAVHLFRVSTFFFVVTDFAMGMIVSIHVDQNPWVRRGRGFQILEGTQV